MLDSCTCSEMRSHEAAAMHLTNASATRGGESSPDLHWELSSTGVTHGHNQGAAGEARECFVIYSASIAKQFIFKWTST